MNVLAFFVLLAAVMVGLYFGIWALYGATNDNPCNPFRGARTGAVEYRGHTFECWHGEIVGMR